MSKQKKVLSLGEKMEIINVLEKEHLTIRELGKRFNIGKSQAGTIAKEKEYIRKQWHSGTVNASTKKIFRNSNGALVDKKCFEWFSRARSQNIPISGPIIKAKAKAFAEELEYNNFTASDGWLQKFRKRHDISFKSISGEAMSVDQSHVTRFIENLSTILANYKPEDIYNADDSGLFFRALPDKTMAFKSEKCIGGKFSKERLTILFCVNMAGEKEKVMVIGKAARPRAFKNIAIKDLPVFWKYNQKAWMTRDIMSEWLEQFNRKMGIQNRKILLFLNNAASHPKHLKLENIKIVFFPPNTTAVCQPLDQGIIQNFKIHYRAVIVKDLLPNNEASDSEIKNINILDAVYHIKESWSKVKPETIKNCFVKAGFTKYIIDSSLNPEDDIPLSGLATLIRHAPEENFCNAYKFLHVKIEENIPTESYDIDCFNEVQNVDCMYNDDEYIVPEAEEEISNKITSYKEALEHIQRVRIFAEEQDYTSYEHLKFLERYYTDQILNEAKAKLMQKRISDFSNPL